MQNTLPDPPATLYAWYEVIKNIAMALVALLLWTMRGAFFGGKKASDYENKLRELEERQDFGVDSLQAVNIKLDKASAKQSEMESRTMTKIIEMELQVQDLITTLSMTRLAIDRDHLRYDREIVEITRRVDQIERGRRR